MTDSIMQQAGEHGALGAWTSLPAGHVGSCVEVVTSLCFSHTQNFLDLMEGVWPGARKSHKLGLNYLKAAHADTELGYSKAGTMRKAWRLLEYDRDFNSL